MHSNRMQRTASDVFPITQQWYVSDRVCRAASTVSLFNSVWSSLLFLIFFLDVEVAKKGDLLPCHLTLELTTVPLTYMLTTNTITDGSNR